MSTLNSKSTFDEQAAALRRDLFLLLRHIHTLPFVFGTPGWWLYDRYTMPQPYTERSFRLYNFELLGIDNCVECNGSGSMAFTSISTLIVILV